VLKKGFIDDTKVVRNLFFRLNGFLRAKNCGTKANHLYSFYAMHKIHINNNNMDLYRQEPKGIGM